MIDYDPSSEPSSASSLQYSVSVWETISIIVGALLLIAVGLAGLGVKALNNAFDPQRAEDIARSMLLYDIPGGSRGLFGTNVGGAKLAVVASTALPQASALTLPEDTPPAIELLVARIPLSQETDEGGEETPNEFFSGFSFSYQVEEAFQVDESRIEYREFCGAVVPIEIQQGRLTLSNQTTRLPAVKYSLNVEQERDDYVAILATVGQSAEEQAESVFKSLRCTNTISEMPLSPFLIN
ncbi:MAG: hypothetical protein Kow00121_28790 [Elainellaceae cyanobacterium]